MASDKAQRMHLTDQLANSLQGARSPDSQSPPLPPLHCWSSDYLSGQQAGHVSLPSSDWLALPLSLSAQAACLR